MAGEILYFLHRNFRGLIVLGGLVCLVVVAWLLTGAGVAEHAVHPVMTDL